MHFLLHAASDKVPKDNIHQVQIVSAYKKNPSENRQVQEMDWKWIKVSNVQRKTLKGRLKNLQENLAFWKRNIKK